MKRFWLFCFATVTLIALIVWLSVRPAQDWRWSCLGCDRKLAVVSLLSHWPLDRPPDWLALVNEPPPQATAQRIRTSMIRGCPLGNDAWTRRSAARMSLMPTLRSRGRPRRPVTEKRRRDSAE